MAKRRIKEGDTIVAVNGGHGSFQLLNVRHESDYVFAEVCPEGQLGFDRHITPTTVCYWRHADGAEIDLSPEPTKRPVVVGDAICGPGGITIVIASIDFYDYDLIVSDAGKRLARQSVELLSTGTEWRHANGDRIDVEESGRLASRSARPCLHERRTIFGQCKRCGERGLKIDAEAATNRTPPPATVIGSDAGHVIHEPAVTARQLHDADPELLAHIRKHADVEKVHRESTTTLQYEGRPRVDGWEIRVEVTERLRAALDRAWERNIIGKRAHYEEMVRRAMGGEA